jgi:plasmid stability protein
MAPENRSFYINHLLQKKMLCSSGSEKNNGRHVLHMKYAYSMSKMIQLRNVPDALHRRLKARAAIAGMSISDYLLAEIREIAERPTLAELRDRLHKRTAIAARLDTARVVRKEREAR